MSKWLARAALVFGAPIALLTTIELLGWAAGVQILRDDPAYQTLSKSRACQLGGDPGAFCGPEKLKTPQGVTSVAVLGGSSVRGYPRGMQPFPERMRRLLDEAQPGRYRIFNFGLYCKDSIFVAACAERLAPAADVLVVYMGHNDVANFMGAQPRMTMWIERNRWLLDLERWLAGTRTYSLLYALRTEGGVPAAAWRPMPAAAFDVAKQEVVDGFRERLQAIVAATARSGTRLVLVTVVSNLHESPFERADWNVRLETAALLPDWQRWRDHFGRGVALYREDRFEAALAEFRSARDVLMQGRAPTEMNELVREVSTRNGHVELVDFERILDGVGARDGIGCNFFGEDDWCDQFHPNSRTHEMIAAAVVEQVLALETARP